MISTLMISLRAALPVVVLLCATPAHAKRMPNCGDMERASKAARGSAPVRRALEVWRRVEGPFRALTGRRTAVSILAADATSREGWLFPPFASRPGRFRGSPTLSRAGDSSVR